MRIAAFTSSEKTIEYVDGAFIADAARVSAHQVLDYDRLGILTWVSDEVRDWVHSLVPSYAADQRQAPPGTPPSAPEDDSVSRVTSPVGSPADPGPAMERHEQIVIPAVPMPTPPGWHADPASRHELRYWDGAVWTDHVQDAGVPLVDPVPVRVQAPARPEVVPDAATIRTPDPFADWVKGNKKVVLVLGLVALVGIALWSYSSQRSNRAIVIEYVQVWDLVRVRDIDDGEVHYADPVEGLTLHIGDEVRLADGNDGGFYVEYVGVLEGEDVRRVVEVTRPAEAQ